jgi:cell division protein FtsN
MRFEIGPGGIFVILLGLAGLSAAVFGLGMVAGHELAGPEPGSQPVAAAYPLPQTAPASVPSVASPVEATAPAATVPSVPVAQAATRRTVESRTAVAARTTRPAAEPAAESDEAPSTGASVAPPEARSASAEPAEPAIDEGEREGAAPAPVQPAHRRLTAVNPPAPRAASGPYSVQIDAMMDWQGAQQMAQKIRAKGFQPYIVSTNVDGKTWYRLRVGHYATPEQAQDAETRLHQDFNQ